MSKHTPGPWKVASSAACQEIDVFEIAEVSDLRVIHAVEAWPTPGKPEDDARLIAAAPDLLRSLEYAVGILAAYCGSDHPETHNALAAIAKATGEAA